MDWEQRCKELQQRIEELEKENRELRRKLGYPELVQSVVTEAFKTEVMQEPAVGANVHMRSTPEEKSDFSAVCFVVGRMCLPGGGIAFKKEKVDMHRYAPTSGDMVFVSSLKVNVPSVKTGCWYRWMML